MGFIERVKQIATGKSAIERRQEAVAMGEIRKKAIAAGLRERETQAVKFAAEREKAIYEKRTKALRQPKKGIFGVVAPEFKTYGSPFGQPRFFRGRNEIVRGKKHKTVYVKKGKHYVKKRIRIHSIPSNSSPSYKFKEVMGRTNKYDVLGI